jgi:CheY-like chemotaxis protein/HPt (histidine-containing phosphotransfer) domain-containing protein
VTRDDEIAAALRPTFAREAGPIAAQLEDASRGGRRDELHSLAHRLVGSAATVREVALVDAARTLERLTASAAADDETVAAHTRAVANAVRELIHSIRPEPAAGGADAGSSAAGRPVVVAIDDSPANVTLLHRIFESIPGVELVTSQSGRDGARIALDRHASLVLLDLNLPDVSGEWVLDALRGADGHVVTNVVVVSGDATPGQAEQARRLGATDYVEKPFDIAKLRALVRDACLS